MKNGETGVTATDEAGSDFGPFFATVFLTLLVWLYMYIRRISFIMSRGVSS